MTLKQIVAPEAIAEATEAMRRRVETGKYAEAEIVDGVTLVWDEASSPYIVMARDSPFCAGIPDERHRLCDALPHGDKIASAASEILTNATGDDDSYPEFEKDERNSNEHVLIWHCHYVRIF